MSKLNELVLLAGRKDPVYKETYDRLSTECDILIDKLLPTPAAKVSRSRAFEYICKLIHRVNPRALPFAFGSVPSSVFLPDGDIDVGVCVHPSGASEFFSKLSQVLCNESSTASQLSPEDIIAKSAAFTKESETLAHANTLAKQSYMHAEAAYQRAVSTANSLLDMTKSEHLNSNAELTKIEEITNEAALAAAQAKSAAETISSISDPMNSSDETMCANTMPLTHIRHVESAEVKLVKCCIAGLPADISANTLAGLGAVCLVEDVDAYIGRDHLFKRSVLLCKAWADHEAHILASSNFLLSSYALEILVLYVLNIHCADALRMEDAYKAHQKKCSCAQASLKEESKSHHCVRDLNIRRTKKSSSSRSHELFSFHRSPQSRRSNSIRQPRAKKLHDPQVTGSRPPMEFLRFISCKPCMSVDKAIGKRSKYYSSGPLSTLERIEHWLSARAKYRASQARNSVLQLQNHTEQFKKRLQKQQQVTSESTDSHKTTVQSKIMKSVSAASQGLPPAQSGCKSAAATVALTVIAEGLDSFALRNGTGASSSSSQDVEAYDELVQGTRPDLLDVFSDSDAESVRLCSETNDNSIPCEKEGEECPNLIASGTAYQGDEEDDVDEWGGADIFVGLGSDTGTSDSDRTSEYTDTASETADYSDSIAEPNTGDKLWGESGNDNAALLSRFCSVDTMDASFLENRKRIRKRIAKRSESVHEESKPVTESERLDKQHVSSSHAHQEFESSPVGLLQVEANAKKVEADQLFETHQRQDVNKFVEENGEDYENDNDDDDDGEYDEFEFYAESGAVSKPRNRARRRRRKRAPSLLNSAFTTNVDDKQQQRQQPQQHTIRPRESGKSEQVGNLTRDNNSNQLQMSSDESDVDEKSDSEWNNQAYYDPEQPYPFQKKRKRRKPKRRRKPKKSANELGVSLSQDSHKSTNVNESSYQTRPDPNARTKVSDDEEEEEEEDDGEGERGDEGEGEVEGDGDGGDDYDEIDDDFSAETYEYKMEDYEAKTQVGVKRVSSEEDSMDRHYTMLDEPEAEANNAHLDGDTNSETDYEQDKIENDEDDDDTDGDDVYELGTYDYDFEGEQDYEENDNFGLDTRLKNEYDPEDDEENDEDNNEDNDNDDDEDDDDEDDDDEEDDDDDVDEDDDEAGLEGQGGEYRSRNASLRRKRRQRAEMDRRSALRAKLNRKHRKRLAESKMKRVLSTNDSTDLADKIHSDPEIDTSFNSALNDHQRIEMESAFSDQDSSLRDVFQNQETTESDNSSTGGKRPSSRGSSRNSRRQARRRRNAQARRVSASQQIRRDASALSMARGLAVASRNYIYRACKRESCCPCVVRPSPHSVTPFYVLSTFISVIASFDWSNFAVSIGGPVPLEALRVMQAQMLNPNAWKVTDNNSSKPANSYKLPTNPSISKESAIGKEALLWNVPSSLHETVLQCAAKLDSDEEAIHTKEISLRDRLQSQTDSLSCQLMTLSSGGKEMGGRRNSRHSGSHGLLPQVPVLRLDDYADNSTLKKLSPTPNLLQPKAANSVPFLPQLETITTDTQNESIAISLRSCLDQSEMSAHQKEIRLAFPSSLSSDNKAEKIHVKPKQFKSSHDFISDDSLTSAIKADVDSEHKIKQDKASCDSKPEKGTSQRNFSAGQIGPATPTRLNSTEWAWYTLTYPTKHAPLGTLPYLPFDFVMRCATLYGAASLVPGVPAPPRVLPARVRNSIMKHSLVLSAAAQASALALAAGVGPGSQPNGVCQIPTFQAHSTTKPIVSSIVLDTLSSLSKASKAVSASSDIVNSLKQRSALVSDELTSILSESESDHMGGFLREAAVAAANEVLDLWSQKTLSQEDELALSLPQIPIPLSRRARDHTASASGDVEHDKDSLVENARSIFVSRAVHARQLASFLKCCQAGEPNVLASPVHADRVFSVRTLNIVDPLDWGNNLGRSVSVSSAYRIKGAFTKAAESLHGAVTVSDRLVAPSRSLPSPAALVQSALAHSTAKATCPKSEGEPHFVTSWVAGAQTSAQFMKAMIKELSSVSHVAPGKTLSHPIPSPVLDRISHGLNGLLRITIAMLDALLQPLPPSIIASSLSCDDGERTSELPSSKEGTKVEPVSKNVPKMTTTVTSNDSVSSNKSDGFTDQPRLEQEAESQQRLNLNRWELQSVNSASSKPLPTNCLLRASSDAVIPFLIQLIRSNYKPGTPFLNSIFVKHACSHTYSNGQSTSLHSSIASAIQTARAIALRAAALSDVQYRNDHQGEFDEESMKNRVLHANNAAKEAAAKSLAESGFLSTSDNVSTDGSNNKQYIMDRQNLDLVYPLLNLIRSLASSALVAVYFEKLKYAAYKISKVAASTVASIAVATASQSQPHDKTLASILTHSMISSSLGTLGLGQRIGPNLTIGPLSAASIHASPFTQLFAAPLGSLGAASLFLTCPKYIDRTFRFLRWALVSSPTVSPQSVSVSREPIDMGISALSSDIPKRLLSALISDRKTITNERDQMERQRKSCNEAFSAFQGNLREKQWQLIIFRYMNFLNSPTRTSGMTGVTPTSAAITNTTNSTLCSKLFGSDQAGDDLLILSEHKVSQFTNLAVAQPLTDTQSLNRLAANYARAGKLPSFANTENIPQADDIQRGDIDAKLMTYYGGRKPDLDDPVPSSLHFRNEFNPLDPTLSFSSKELSDGELKSPTNSKQRIRRVLADEVAAALLAPPISSSTLMSSQVSAEPTVIESPSKINEESSQPVVLSAWGRANVSYAERLRTANNKALAIAAAIAHSRKPAAVSPEPATPTIVRSIIASSPKASDVDIVKTPRSGDAFRSEASPNSRSIGNLKKLLPTTPSVPISGSSSSIPLSSQSFDAVPLSTSTKRQIFFETQKRENSVANDSVDSAVSEAAWESDGCF